MVFLTFGKYGEYEITVIVISVSLYYNLNYVCAYVKYHFCVATKTINVSKHLKLKLYDHTSDLKMVIIIVFSIWFCIE